MAKQRKKDEKKVKGNKKKKEKKAKQPVPLIDENRRSDSDALVGRPAEHDGEEGTIVNVAEWNKTTGYPKTVVFRSRNNGNSLETVKYDDVKALNEGFR